ncbi:MAG: uracil-DNA glycosylase family protein [Acetobacterales bacterium]
MTGRLDALLKEVRACRMCAGYLPLGPRPVLSVSPPARILIIGQAPGTRVHETGIPWNDPSGERLRQWMVVDRETFYDASRIAIMPMGLCYPGRLARGGDAPPRKECAPAWHARVRAELPDVELTLLVGSYAQAFYLHGVRKLTMTGTVRAFREYLPDYLPLPHPSWRTTGWLRRNPWFETDVLPELRARVVTLLAPTPQRRGRPRAPRS